MGTSNTPKFQPRDTGSTEESTAASTAPEALPPMPVTLPGLPGPSEAQPQGAVVTTDAASVAQATAADPNAPEKRTYDTQWGRREMPVAEAAELRAQGLTVTEVDADPEVSLQSEKDDMRGVVLTKSTTRDDN